MSDLATFSSRDELVSAVKGKSDRLLLTEAEAAGAEMILQKVFMGMLMSFDAGRAAGQSAIIEYDIEGPQGARHCYQVKVAKGECTIGPGGTEPPTVTLRASLPTFLKLTTRTANPILLVMFGKLRLKGDRKAASELQRWFSKRL